MSEQQTLLVDVPIGAASLLTDVLGVGSARMHPHENKFHAGNGEDGKHYWLTPPDLYAQLDAEFGFDFDPCPFPKPADFDGLTCEWGQRNYVNPPFGSIVHQGKKKGPTAWMRKAIEEQRKGKLSVVVYPVDKWVLMMLAATGAQNVRNLGDVKWCATEDGSQGKGTGRHIACFVLTPNDRVEGRDAALSRRVPSHDGLGGTDNGGEMITGGFGTTMDLERGTSRQWVVGRDGVKRWADNGEPVEAPAEPAPIDEWAERCLGTWPQLQEHWKYMLAETKRLKRENSLLRQALTRAVALPMGQLPHGDEYFTTMLNGNVIVMPNAKVSGAGTASAGLPG